MKIGALTAAGIVALGFAARPASAGEPDDCAAYELAYPRRGVVIEDEAEGLGHIAGCLNRLAVEVDALRAAMGEAPDAVGERKLVDFHDRYQKLKRWYRRMGGDDEGRSLENAGTLKQLATVGKNVHDLMSTRGLRQPFSGVLLTGPVLADPGRDGDTAPAEGDATRFQESVYVEWESRHLDDEDGGLDFSLGGRFGFLPALSLVRDASTGAAAAASTTTSEPTATYQEAFVWDVGPRVNVQLGEIGELSFQARAGQVRLNSESVLVERGADSVVAVAVGNGTSQAEWFWETGVALKVFRDDLELRHEEKSLLSPALEIAGGLRHDGRFRKEGDLAAFDNPERRLYFRFMLDALRIVDKRERGTPGRTFSIGIGVEYERGFGSPRVPSGTKLLLRGDLDLLKALRGRG